MKEIIVECVITYNNNSTEFVPVDILLLEGSSNTDSAIDYLQKNRSNVKHIQIIDVLWVVKRAT